MQRQLLEVVREVASNDFPQQWPGLLPEALHNIAGNDLSRMYGSLLVLRSVASCLEFSSGSDVKLQVPCVCLLPCCVGRARTQVMIPAAPAVC